MIVMVSVAEGARIKADRGFAHAFESSSSSSSHGTDKHEGHRASEALDVDVASEAAVGLDMLLHDPASMERVQKVETQQSSLLQVGQKGGREGAKYIPRILRRRGRVPTVPSMGVRPQPALGPLWATELAAAERSPGPRMRTEGNLHTVSGEAPAKMSQGIEADITARTLTSARGVRSMIPSLVSSPRHAAVRAQQGPLEEGFKELLPMATEDGNVDPNLVSRVEQEVFDLTGRQLEDLLNPSKVVNYEREVILLNSQIEVCADASEREELKARLDKIEKQLYSEKRTVFSDWLKAVFVGQAFIASIIGGFAAFDAFPTFTLDISLQALGFWSWWLFIIPSLRARRPRGWEKLALDIAFLGSPIITIGAPFVIKEPSFIWSANLAFFLASYAYGFTFGRGEGAQEAGSFSGPLRYLDFGSGQERGVRGKARERLFSKEREQQGSAEGESEPDEAAADGAKGGAED